jgi:hypothetical protein
VVFLRHLSLSIWWLRVVAAVAGLALTAVAAVRVGLGLLLDLQ